MAHHLTPQKRLDKNGRLVTKHVRTGPQETRKPLSIPKVFAVKAEMGVFGMGSERDSQRITDMLARLDQNDLYALRDTMKQTDERTREQLKKLILNASYTVSDEEEYPARLHSKVQNAAVLLPILNVIHAPTGGFPEGNIDILTDYMNDDLKENAPENLLTASESEQNLAKGYCMMSQAGMHGTLSHEEMEWVGAHSDVLIPHFERIEALGRFDREFCEALIANESPSMSSGVL